MAIAERQKLINLHTSGTSKPEGLLELGEIAVQHNSVEGARLFIDTVSGGTGSAETLAEFVPKSYIDNAISGITGNTSSAITEAINALDVPDEPVDNQVVLSVKQEDGKISVQRSGLTTDYIPTLEIDKINGLQGKLDNKIETSLIGSATTVTEAISGSTNLASEKLVYDGLSKANAYTDGVAKGINDVIGSGFESGNTISDQLKTVKNTADNAATKEELSSLTQTVNSKVSSITSGSTGIEIGGEATTPTISLKLDNSGNVQFSEGVDGLKAEVEIPSATVTGVKSNDKVLELEGTELKTTIGLKYGKLDSGDTGDTKYIILTGKDGQTIASIDATEFIKDGMVNTVTFDPETKNLKITFNTDAGKEEISVDLTSLVTTYTSGNGIDISGTVISAKIDESSESYLTVGDGGIKLSGVKNAIDTSLSEAKSYADSLGSNYATAAQGAKADTAVQSIAINGLSDGSINAVVSSGAATIDLSKIVIDCGKY